MLTVVPNYTSSRLLTGFEFRPNFLCSLVIPTFAFPIILTFLVKKRKMKLSGVRTRIKNFKVKGLCHGSPVNFV